MHSECLHKSYYSFPGLTADTPELLLNTFSIPQDVLAEKQFQIWYADDFYDCLEFDNDRETCVWVVRLTLGRTPKLILQAWYNVVGRGEVVAPPPVFFFLSCC